MIRRFCSSGATSRLLFLAAMSIPGIAQESRGPRFISMVQLLSNPEQYNGKLIRVVGYLWIEPEGSAIYLHKEDKINSLTKNAIQISVSEEMYKRREELSGYYVLIEGVFSSDDKGHMELYSGVLQSIQRISPRHFKTR